MSGIVVTLARVCVFVCVCVCVCVASSCLVCPPACPAPLLPWVHCTDALGACMAYRMGWHGLAGLLYRHYKLYGKWEEGELLSDSPEHAAAPLPSAGKPGTTHAVAEAAQAAQGADTDARYRDEPYAAWSAGCRMLHGNAAELLGVTSVPL